MTATLCIAPTCRLRGRHLPGCQDPTCPVNCECHNGPHYACSEPGGCGSAGCGKPVDCTGCLPRVADDGLICDPCLGRAAAQLEIIADLTSAARDVAHRLSGNQGGAGGPGKPGSRLPLDLGALARLDGVANALGIWVRLVAEERGIYPPHIPAGFDVIEPSARFLLQHLDWARHRREADELLRDITAAVRIVRGILDGPGEQKYLGPCGVEISIGTLSQPDLMHICDGDVYGRPGAQHGTCRACKTEHSQEQRRIWLDSQVSGSDLAWTARGIADALNLNVKTVRAWATPHTSDTGTVLRPAKLATYYRLGEHIVPWTEPEKGEDVKARGDRLHYVGDVRRLAQESADRREAERQRRDSVQAERMSA